MKDTNVTKEKRIVLESHGNKECIYYISLFGIAIAAAIAMLVFSIIKSNTGLMTYSCVLLPVFALAMLLSVIIYINSKNPITVTDGVLSIKKGLCVKKIALAKIDKIAVSADGKSDVSIVKVSYGEKVARYKFKNISKETASVLRKLKK